MKTALIYCRSEVRLKPREPDSLDGQEKACKLFAQNNGYYVSGIYWDDAKSEGDINREGLRNMIIACENNKNIDAVIIRDIDRLSRNLDHHLKIYRVLKKFNIKLLTVDQQKIPEYNLTMTIMDGVEEFYKDLKKRHKN